MSNPKVSVSLITYNQEKYIAQCIESIIGQITDFEFEIVIADDCSSDRTPVIVSEYATKYPEIIKPILRDTNIGLVKNAIATIAACSGKYIALMEGDDFWVDNQKLQIQSDYLDYNPECTFCFTNQYHFMEGNPSKQYIAFNASNKPPIKFDLAYFMKSNTLIPNNTTMFRKSVQPSAFPDWFYGAVNWDWVLHILHAEKGSIGYIDRITLAYRRHPEALHMAKNQVGILLNGIEIKGRTNKLLNSKFSDTLLNFSWEYFELSFSYLNNRDLINFFFYYYKYLISPNKAVSASIRDNLWRVKQAPKNKN